MCLLITGFHAVPDQAVLLAANRDERYDRPALGPTLLHARPRAVGGRDLEAGGTWLGVNEYGLIAAITNLGCGTSRKENTRSRGLLCLDVLTESSARTAVRAASEACRRDSYNPFTLLLVDIDEAWCLTSTAPDRPVQLRPGWHIVSNSGLNAPDCPRRARVLVLIEQTTFEIQPGFPRLLAGLCRDHGACGDGTWPDAVCRHGDRAGTRSSSILRIDFGLKIRFWHADGPPCNTPYEEVRLPWNEDAAPASRESASG